jgi:uncharacterized tellurite resistance protein B-like protein
MIPSTMSLLDLFRSRRDAAGHAGDTETVRRVVRELDQLEPTRARFLAAFAYVLSRVASADLEISPVETEKMIAIVRRLGHLPEEQALLVVEIAKKQNLLFGGTENFLVTREFREIATDEERHDLLDCLFAVSAADDSISLDEEAQIRQTASELGFSHAEFVKARMAYSEKRSVLKEFKEGS